MQPLWDGLLHHLFGDTINCHCTALSGTWLLVYITSGPVQLISQIETSFCHPIGLCSYMVVKNSGVATVVIKHEK